MRHFLLLFFISQPIYANDYLSLIYNYFVSSTYEEKTTAPDAFPSTRPSEKENIFIFSPKHHMWALYNTKGKRVGIGKAIGGKDYCQDTNDNCRTVTGKFKVFRKENKDCTSNTFPIHKGGGAPMPYCMFFHEGYAIHGANHLPEENTSHGCIRVTQEAARWINHYYLHEGSYVLVLPYA
jgi:lipoprotein-anchoring transpeptidase ErfK/SrfK